MDICDFCDSPKVVRRYQCMDFKAESADAGLLHCRLDASGLQLTNVVLDSMSYWAACAACARYVDAEDLDGLVTHACAGLNVAEHNLVVRVHLRHAYKLFFKNRIRVREDKRA